VTRIGHANECWVYKNADPTLPSQLRNLASSPDAKI
jgi:hypothetical protein